MRLTLARQRTVLADTLTCKQGKVEERDQNGNVQSMGEKQKLKLKLN